jgi:hypothetical protein
MTDLNYEVVEFANGTYASRMVATPSMFISLEGNEVWPVRFAAKYCQSSDFEAVRSAALSWIELQQALTIVRVISTPGVLEQIASEY